PEFAAGDGLSHILDRLPRFLSHALDKAPAIVYELLDIFARFKIGFDVHRVPLFAVAQAAISAAFADEASTTEAGSAAGVLVSACSVSNSLTTSWTKARKVASFSLAAVSMAVTTWA